jgi:hypothetical protein
VADAQTKNERGQPQNDANFRRLANDGSIADHGHFIFILAPRRQQPREQESLPIDAAKSA